MTLLGDRPAVSENPASHHRVARSTSTVASWRFASRLARREVRRRPGRTLLVMLLVALPVFAMTVAAVAARTAEESMGLSFEREYGTADIAVYGRAFSSGDGRQIIAGDAAWLLDEGPLLPPGTESVTYVETWTVVAGTDADGNVARPSVRFVVVDAANPIIAPTFKIRRGRLASGPGEVMLSADVARAFGVDVGDTLRLTLPEVSATVVGIHSEAAWSPNSSMVMPGFDTSLLRPEATLVSRLIDVPDTTTDAETAVLVEKLREGGIEAQSTADRGWEEPGVDAEQLAWGWVAGVVAFIAVGIVIAAAFATSARRQLATVGQLSANGASERLVRRTLGLQGMWTGAIGAVFGIGAGVAAVLVAHRMGLADLVTGHAVDSVRIPPLELVVVALTALVAATIAALVPARSASRIPVLSALAGRRPVSTPPRWLVPVGLGLFGFGVFLIAAAAGSSNGGNFPAAIAVLGVLGVLFGLVCSSPLIVSWVSDIGSRRGGVTRLAARSLGRSRMRSAGVLTAVATVSAIAIASLTATGSARAEDEEHRRVEDDNSVFDVWHIGDHFRLAPEDLDGADPGGYRPPTIIPPISDELRNQIESIIPHAQWYEIRDVAYYEPPRSELAAPDAWIVDHPTIADEAALSLLNLTEEQLQRLDEVGVLNISTYLSGSVAVRGPDGLIPIDAGTQLASTQHLWVIPSRFRPEVLITPEFASARGLETQVNRVIIDNPTDYTPQERDALNSLGNLDVGDSFVGGDNPTNEPRWEFYVNGPRFALPWTVIQIGVLIAALTMVLMVVAIGLSLAAAESRDERDVLHTVGASPSTLRRVAAAKAWVLTTGAAAVSIPTGYTVVRVITWVNHQPAPFPIVGAVGIAIAIPAVVWAATLIVSAIAQKARPIHVSTLTLD